MFLFLFGYLFPDHRSIGADANVVAGGIPYPDAGTRLDGPTNLFTVVVRQPTYLRALHGRTRPLHLVKCQF